MSAPEERFLEQVRSADLGFFYRAIHNHGKRRVVPLENIAPSSSPPRAHRMQVATPLSRSGERVLAAPPRPASPLLLPVLDGVSKSAQQVAPRNLEGNRLSVNLTHGNQNWASRSASADFARISAQHAEWARSKEASFADAQRKSATMSHVYADAVGKSLAGAKQLLPLALLAKKRHLLGDDVSKTPWETCSLKV